MDILNAKEYIENFLYIKTKSGDIRRLKMNPPQQKLYEIIKRETGKKKPIRIIILKFNINFIHKHLLGNLTIKEHNFIMYIRFKKIK